MLVHFTSSDKTNYLLVKTVFQAQGLPSHDCAEKSPIVQAVIATQVMYILSITDQKPLISYWMVTIIDNYQARLEISHQEKGYAIHYHSQAFSLGSLLPLFLSHSCLDIKVLLQANFPNGSLQKYIFASIL